MKILVLNAGSSTYKGALFNVERTCYDIPLEPLWEGLLDFGIDSKMATLRIIIPKRKTFEKQIPNKNLSESVEELFKTAWMGPDPVISGPEELEAVGHRVVHGGDKFQKPIRITQEVKNAIRELIPLAPLQNPASLAGIEILQALFPSVPHVAVFDTAYHATIPDYAAAYALPSEYNQLGIRRYGFHGISHEYCSKRAASLLEKNLSGLKMITCHLGNGSSLAAIAGGKSIDTTMGFTPMEGLMMGTRCGSIDPGILLYLLRENHVKVNDLDHCLNYEAGLKGVCGSADMREVMQKRQNGKPEAVLAFEMLLHSLHRNIGSMIGVLGGLDVLVLAGGIGENIPEIRELVCCRLNYLGAELDSNKNQHVQGDQEISLSSSKIKVLVIHTREELAIAQACFDLHSF